MTKSEMRKLMEELRDLGVPMTQDITDGVCEYVMEQRKKGRKIEELNPRIVAQHLDQTMNYDIVVSNSVEDSGPMWESPY